MADQPSCTCGDVYAGFPRNGEAPTSNQYDSTCPVHGAYKELDRQKQSNQPSKESLERARNWLHHACGEGECSNHSATICLALEFDAIAKERDAALIRANSGLELIKLRQQNAALVGALRELEQRWRIAAYHNHPFAGAGIIACADELTAVLTFYAPTGKRMLITPR